MYKQHSIVNTGNFNADFKSVFTFTVAIKLYFILFKYIFRSLVFQVFSIFPAELTSDFYSMESGTSSRSKKLARKGS